MGQPQDLMGPVAFLLSDVSCVFLYHACITDCFKASSYVTGADIRVDGGYTVT